MIKNTPDIIAFIIVIIPIFLITVFFFSFCATLYTGDSNYNILSNYDHWWKTSKDYYQNHISYLSSMVVLIYFYNFFRVAHRYIIFTKYLPFIIRLYYWTGVWIIRYFEYIFIWTGEHIINLEPQAYMNSFYYFLILFWIFCFVRLKKNRYKVLIFYISLIFFIVFCSPFTGYLTHWNIIIVTQIEMVLFIYLLNKEKT